MRRLCTRCGTKSPARRRLGGMASDCRRSLERHLTAQRFFASAAGAGIACERSSSATAPSCGLLGLLGEGWTVGDFGCGTGTWRRRWLRSSAGSSRWMNRQRCSRARVIAPAIFRTWRSGPAPWKSPGRCRRAGRRASLLVLHHATDPLTVLTGCGAPSSPAASCSSWTCSHTSMSSTGADGAPVAGLRRVSTRCTGWKKPASAGPDL